MPGHDDAPDLGVGQTCKLRRHALHRTTRLDVAVEQVARDEEEIGLLGQGEVHGRDERGELPLALRGGLFTEVVMACAEVDVRGVDDP